jgi:putative two-component system response regulator
MFEQHRILIVDDSPLNLQSMQSLLRGEYTLAVATDGPTAIQKVRTFAPDLILCDTMLPGQSGYEVCEAIKRGPCAVFTQVILVSWEASPAERLRGYRCGADDYLTRPFEPEELLAKIHVHFRLRDAQIQLWEAHSLIQKHNADLEQLVRERAAEVVAMQDVAVFAMAELAETRDSDTGHHLLRMRAYAQRLAEELRTEGPYAAKITDAFLYDLYRATPLHDIGKVGVPDAVLLKPGKLTAAEFEQMKQHVEIGAVTLERAAQRAGGGDFLAMAARIARYHHERFDGSGYLAGLSGTRIPLCARITALADVYDALTTARVYKDALSHEATREMIIAESGKQFDPEIVAAFERCSADFESIPEQFEPLCAAFA